MLGALRRCTASIPRSIASVTSSSRIPSFCLSSLSSQITRVPRTRTFHQSSKWLQEAATRERADDEHEAVDQFQGPLTEFKDLAKTGIIHENVVKTLTGEMKLETMTEVQSATITAALDGTDMYDTWQEILNRNTNEGIASLRPEPAQERPLLSSSLSSNVSFKPTQISHTEREETEPKPPTFAPL